MVEAALQDSRQREHAELGVYPDVSLSMARDRRNAARRLIAITANELLVQLKKIDMPISMRTVTTIPPIPRGSHHGARIGGFIVVLAVKRGACQTHASRFVPITVDR
jgi:hypothetical protein